MSEYWADIGTFEQIKAGRISRGELIDPAST